eukprot:TRINITY_DN40310_c0_g1_i1.p1 TRINITY_DN40310_c0_g1~~TRINITY_DN40310_c0_g1_i1.p1  ORF type:complete len:365 (-),score=72.99 TRINITY_DN40310_c0_g1_i1:102-1196(-)
MNSWAAGAKYDCNFLCICVLGDRSAYGLCREMSNQMKLTHCVNAFVAKPDDMPTYGQLGCQGFIVLDKEHKVVSDGTTPFMQVRDLAFQHVEALLGALCSGLPVPDICPGEQAKLVEAPSGSPQLKGAMGICVKINGDEVDFGFMDGPLRGRMMRLPKNIVQRLGPEDDEEEAIPGGGCPESTLVPARACENDKCSPGSGTCGPSGACADGTCNPGSCGGSGPGSGGYKVDAGFVQQSLDVASVKVPSMDAEHEECANALRQLVDQMSKTALEAVLKCLSDHFAHEEELLKEFDFGAHVNEKLSARKSHCDDHRRILDKVRRQLAATADAVPAAFVQEVLQEFHEHTSRYDVQYADHLSERGAR